jgi:hypothetical protein
MQHTGMNKEQLQAAFKIAESDADLMGEDISIFDGFALKDFKPVHCTLRAVAYLMRWQARYLNGKWDQQALDEVCHWARYRFICLG